VRRRSFLSGRSSESGDEGTSALKSSSVQVGTKTGSEIKRLLSY
jgi:hypothetical protein